MRHQIFLGSTLLCASSRTHGQDANRIHRQLDKGGKPKTGLFVDNQLPHQNTRDLRAVRRDHVGKNNKSPPDENDNMQDYDDNDMHDYDGDGGMHGKSGKLSKGGESIGGSKSGKSSHPQYTPYHMAPFLCTNMCIDADGADFRTGALNKAVKSCRTHEMHGQSQTQRWIVHEENNLIKVESYAYRGQCISVNYSPGERANGVHDRCHDGILALLPCDDPASRWYLTGGELLSFFCWSSGVSSKMSVSHDADKEDKCYEELLSSSGTEKRKGRDDPDQNKIVSSTFMFITSEDMYVHYDPMTESPNEDPTPLPTYFPTINPTMSP